MRTTALMAMFALLIVPASLQAADDAKFVSGPTATRDGGGVRIAFEVSSATDVAVFIENADGRVVRHLVAGVLGPNAPAPLKADALAQTVVWDGKGDYGRPAGEGPFKVRVALGMSAAFDKVLMDDPQATGGVSGLTVGPDGTLYVLSSFGAAVPNWGGHRLTAYDRNGKYLRTLMPFSNELKASEVSGLVTTELEGNILPLVRSIAGRSLYTASHLRGGGIDITAGGVILMPTGGYRGRGPLGITAVDGQGRTPWKTDSGRSLLELSREMWTRPFVVGSSDGKSVYCSGIGQIRLDENKHGVPVKFAAVYRAPLPDRAPGKVFFGSAEETGKDETHLGGSPRGMAVDGKGHLLICDYENDRVVVVNESDGKFVSAFDVPKPDGVAVHPGTGTVYVASIKGKAELEVNRFKDFRAGAAVGQPLKLGQSGNPDYPWHMALDGSGEKPVLWFGGDAGQVLRVEDAGDKFADPVRIDKAGYANGAFVDVQVDRFRPNAEVYVRCGQGNWYRIDEANDKIENVKLDLPSASGSCIAIGADGNIYAPGWPYHLYRFTRDGKPYPWPDELDRYPAGVDKQGKPTKALSGPTHGRYVPVSMTYMTHTIGARPDGGLYVFEPGHHGGRPPKMLFRYDTATGRREGDPIIWKVSDTCIGPKFDAAGNIYVAEQVKPVDQPYPKVFEAVVGELALGKNFSRSGEVRGVQDELGTMYGSIVKFSPRGGMFHLDGEDPWKKQYPDGPKLDKSLKTVQAASFHSQRLYPLKVTGAEWIRMGISHVDLFYCNCENTRFDVDEFGRVFYPDLGRSRVGVLDTAGNDVTHFGRYGNTDDEGLAFSWLIGVGATDNYVYMGDSLNRRFVRAKINYAAEARCDVK